MGKQSPKRLILASGSAGRRELLSRAGYTFEVIPANIDEPADSPVLSAGVHVRTLVQHTAWLKAAAVASKVPDGIIIAADTVGWLHGQVIGKPNDEADARRILRMLGGTEHELWTGAVLWRRSDDLQVAWQEMSKVAFRALTEGELDTYIATRQWEGCSGAYAIQERDDPCVRIVQGSLSNVIGLPMETLAQALPMLTG